MKTYTVTAKRWDRGWELHIDGVGVTQSHGLTDAEEMVRDYIEIMEGVGESFDVVITPEVGDGLDDEVAKARIEAQKAEDLQRAAALRLRHAVARMVSIGMTKADVAVYLDVTPQRVAQLAPAAKKSAKKAAKTTSITAARKAPMKAAGIAKAAPVKVGRHGPGSLGLPAAAKRSR